MDNDQQNHWVKRGTRHFQTHPYPNKHSNIIPAIRKASTNSWISWRISGCVTPKMPPLIWRWRRWPTRTGTRIRPNWAAPWSPPLGGRTAAKKLMGAGKIWKNDEHWWEMMLYCMKVLSLYLFVFQIAFPRIFDEISGIIGPPKPMVSQPHHSFPLKSIFF